MKGRQIENDGFTLVELLVTVLVFTVVMGAAYTLFISQQRTHSSQEDAVDMQQGLRAGMGLMIRDIRLAGYDEPFGDSAGAGITMASASRVGLTMSIFNNFDDDGDGLTDEWDEAGSIAFDGRDNDNDGEIDGYSEEEWANNNGATSRRIDQSDETVIYGFQDADDADSDGIADAGAAQFGRTGGDNVFNVLMEDVHAVAFVYAYDDDNDGFLDRDAGGNVIWGVDTDNDQDLDQDMAGAAINPEITLSRIRAVQVWVLARASRVSQGFVNSQTYTVGSTDITPGDAYVRRLLTTTVSCRNLH